MQKWLLLFLLIFAVACDSADVDEVLDDVDAVAGEIEAVVEDTLDDSSEGRGLSNALTEAAGAGVEQVFLNGAIYTVNFDQPWADAVAVRDGVIVAVGTEDEVFEVVAESAEIIDLEGAMLMPGFQDTHVHLLEAGVNQQFCVLDAFLPPEEYVAPIADCAAKNDDGWVIGAGANVANLLSEAASPIALLDQAVPDRPALILDDLGHGAWANTLAMQAVGYDKLEGHPQGGIIDRNAETGELTGIVLENAQQPLRTAALAPTPENLQLAYDGMADSLYFFAQNGVTSMSDAGGYWTRGHDEVWQRVVDADELIVRAHNALYLYPDLGYEEQVDEITARYSNDEDALLHFNTVKIYLDGIVSQGTAALISAYDGQFGLPGVPEDGVLYFDVATLNRYSAEFDAAGFQIHFHVTGDRGAKLALDAIEHAQTQNGNSDNRHRLTHLYVVDEADFPRFAQLNAGADFQLSPDSLTDDYFKDMAWLLGDMRAENLLPAFALLEAGAVVSISSDFDAGGLSPLGKLEAILTGYGDDAPDLATLVEMMTINAAYQLNQDDTTGSIEVGKWADFVLLDQNLFEVAPSQLSTINVLATYLAGDQVYDSNWE
ncbi:MAG: amidohydrolase [Candidatus Promineifilaceae bacterium]